MTNAAPAITAVGKEKRADQHQSCSFWRKGMADSCLHHDSQYNEPARHTDPLAEFARIEMRIGADAAGLLQERMQASNIFSVRKGSVIEWKQLE